MKKFLILVLFAALLGGAYLSRPSDPSKSFAHYLMSHDGIAPDVAHATADSCDYVDRHFWIDVKQGDKTVYTTVFHRWINRGEVKHAIMEDIRKTEQAAKRLTN